MSGKGNALWIVLLLVGGFCLSPALSSAFQLTPRSNDKKSAPGEVEPEEEATPVVIEREALSLIAPKVYQTPLVLEPIRSLELTAPMDGIVRNLHFESGQRAGDQAEVVRLDSAEQQLLVQRAKANYRVAQLELDEAKSQGESSRVAINEAKLESAKADLDLAELRHQRMQVRAPFEGQVFRVHVVEGEYVRAGDRLLSWGDTSRLQVEIPMERANANVGGTIELRIEELTAQATVEKVLPLAERFEPLRELAQSLVSVVAVVNNSNNQYHVGQTVHVGLIPRNPVAEIPTSAILNRGSGEGRKVQVVRKNFVRDMPIELLGQVGDERVYVSGPFAEGDEIVTSTSQELPDGTQVRPRRVPGAEADAETDERPSRQQPSQQKRQPDGPADF